MAVTAIALDIDRIEKLTDVIEAVQRVHLEPLIPIQQLALHELKQHAVAAAEELAAIRLAEEEAAAAEAAERAKEDAERIRKEEEANQPAHKGGEASVRRELPPLTPPPAR